MIHMNYFFQQYMGKCTLHLLSTNKGEWNTVRPLLLSTDGSSINVTVTQRQRQRNSVVRRLPVSAV